MSIRIKAFTALTSASIVFFSIFAQEDERVGCPVAVDARTQTVDALANRLNQLKSQLDLTDKQVLKMEIAAKRMINKQPPLKFESDELANQIFYRGNPTSSEFWQNVEKKTLTDEQKARLTELEKALAKQVEATAINELAALSSPEIMTQFHLARWQKNFQLSNDQIETLEPILKEQFELGVDDARYPLEVLPKLEEAEALTESQFRLMEQLLKYKTVAFLEMNWTEISCAECHTN